MFERYPILKILVRPRKTIRYLIDHNLFPNPLVFIFLFSILDIPVDNFEDMVLESMSLGNVIPPSYIHSFVTALGLIFIYIYLIGEIYYKLGRLFGGTGSSLEIRSALLWASAPQFVSLLTGSTLFLIVFMNLKFHFSTLMFNNVFEIVKFSNIIDTVGSTISGFFQLLFLSEVHKISLLKGFVLLIIGLLVTIIIAYIIAIITIRFPHGIL